MQVIKRYPNRKLYDTEAKRYITLDGIADIIRSGHEVQVIDHATGEDLTALTLSQIIFEQEKRRSGYLPLSLLTNLIQAGGSHISSLQNRLLSSVDDQLIERILHQSGIPTRRELDRLASQLDALADAIDELAEPR